MTRRLEAGPLLVSLGALLLLVSLFLSWFSGDINAWRAFEVWDLVLCALALGAIAVGMGITTGDAESLDRRILPAAVAAVAVIVASQIIDPPPAAELQDPDTGAWLALAAALLMCAGAVLTYGRVRLAVTVEGREPRQHVAAVDARGPQDPTTDNIPAVRPERAPTGGRLFARDAKPGADDDEPVPVAAAAAPDPPDPPDPPKAKPKPKPKPAAPPEGNEPTGPKQD